ncbi:Integrator complex subunit 5, partial [Desmophyllum pertusum]
MSLSEVLHKWMLFPAVQRVGRGQADVCVQCLLQIAMNSSPHLDWIVAHIGNYHRSSLDVMTHEVLVKLLEQSKKRGERKMSLLSSAVNVIKNTEEGALEVFQLLLENCQKPEDRGFADVKNVDATQAELQKIFSLIMGLLLNRLQEVALQRHSLFYKNTSMASLDTRKTESEFLTEMACHSKDLCKSLLTSCGNKVSNIFHMLVIIAIHSGRTSAAGILKLVLMNSRSTQSLQLFVQLYCELELYYTQLLDDVVKTCLSTVKYPGAASSSNQLFRLLSNFHQLISSESGIQHLSRSKLSSSLQRHHSVFANLLIHPNLEVSLKTLALLLSLDKTLPDKVSYMMKICKTVKSIKLCRKMFLLLAKDDRCRLYLLRLLVEGTLQKEHVTLFGGISPAEPTDSEKDLTKIKVSLLERNRNPHISSHLPLTTNHLCLFSVIVGDVLRKTTERKHLTEQ